MKVVPKWENDFLLRTLLINPQDGGKNKTEYRHLIEYSQYSPQAQSLYLEVLEYLKIVQSTLYKY